MKANLNNSSLVSPGFNPGNSSALNFEHNMKHNPPRLKKSPYEIMGYDQMNAVAPKKSKYPSHSKKFKSKRKF